MDGIIFQDLFELLCQYILFYFLFYVFFGGEGVVKRSLLMESGFCFLCSEKVACCMNTVYTSSLDGFMDNRNKFCSKIVYK